MASLFMYDQKTQETYTVTEAQIQNVEQEDGNVTIYLRPTTAGKCFYLVLTKAEYDLVNDPLDL